MKYKSLSERLKHEPTPWLKKLKAGIYFVKEIQEITGKCESTIKQRLNLLNIPRSYSVSLGHPRILYHWVGIEEYEKLKRKKSKIRSAK